MGAHNFTAIDYGRTAQEAYERATSQATREHGTDPYNGTISTTNGFHLFVLPPRWTSERFEAAAWALEQREFNARDAKTGPAQFRPGARRRVREADALLAAIGPVVADNLLQRLMDKWGTCAAVALSAREQREWLDRRYWPTTTVTDQRTGAVVSHTVHGPKRGTKVFRFFGLAAS